MLSGPASPNGATLSLKRQTLREWRQGCLFIGVLMWAGSGVNHVMTSENTVDRIILILIATLVEGENKWDHCDVMWIFRQILDSLL